jgi:hypothetical protein
MRWRFALALAALMTSAVAQAESALGGSFAWAHEGGGQFAGTGRGYKAFMGTYVRSAGFEIGFVNFGDLGGGDGPHAQAWTSATTIGFPISAVEVYGKVGLALSRVSGTATSQEVNHHRLYYGGGLRFGGEKGLGVRAEYERFQLDSDHLDLASVGLEYRF